MVAITERPTCSGVYTVVDAAALIHATSQTEFSLPATTRHLFRWVKDGLTGQYLIGLKGNAVALTFRDVVSLRLIALLRAQGISSKEIRFAHNEIQKARGWTHPFASEPIWVHGLYICIKENNIPIAITKHWQAAFDLEEFYKGPMHRMIFDDTQYPSIWEPEEGIVLDPKISFGEPCLKGTRIATQVIWALVKAGDSPELVARAYQVPIEKVEAAVAWENTLAA